ncbi:ABC transporter permease [Archangium minus]|uniref:ABC transporter permease n=2 Tax=Archangiaceae TaxID=39 RepID=A0ABY9WZ54_9BACT|nr:ABC transporter permease [Archangium violaceum]WNG48427.1 ABC transporter permease [Archangium minus]
MGWLRSPATVRWPALEHSMWPLFRIAFRNVARNRRRTLITLAALLVGVGAAVLTRAMMNGLQRAMVTNITASATGALQVHRAGYLDNVLSTPLTLDFAIDEAFLARVRAVEGVKAVSPRIQFAGSLGANDESLFLAATAMDPTAESAVCPNRASTFVPGSRFDSPDGILLAETVANALGTQQGGEAVFLAPDRDGTLNGELVHITGATRSVMPDEPKTAVVPLALAQRLLRMEGRATELAVAVHRLEEAPQVAARLREALGPDYEVHTWDDILVQVKENKARDDASMGLIVAVFLVLMLLGVANTLLMSAIERTREIGTMMAVGLRRGKVMGLFLAEAVVLGATGATLGALLGAGLSAWLNHRGIIFTAPTISVPFDIRPYVDVGYLVRIVLLATAGAAVFSLYPAWRASRLRPVEALAGR